MVARSVSGSGRDETRGLVGVDTLKRRAEALVSPMFIHSFGHAECRSGLGVAGDRQDAVLVGFVARVSGLGSQSRPLER